MSILWQDIKYGARRLRKSPAFTLIAVLMLALGIGANAAIFSVVNSVLLRALPFPDSEQLIWFDGVSRAQGITQSSMSVPDFADWQTQNRVFEQMAAFVSGGSLLASNGETERVRGTSVTADFFSLMRVNALMGRALQPGDARKDAESVVVLNYGLWQRRFGGDPNIVGRSVTIAGKATTVVGVMPQGYDFPQRSELWLPLPLNAAAERRDNRYLSVIARLKPGVTLEQAQAQMDTINARFGESYRETNNNWGAQLTNLREQLVGEMRAALLLLLGAVAFVLLIACANVANLLLARATARRKEIAVRMALGASRGRIARQLISESLLLSFAGGAAGLLLSVWLTDLFIAISPANSPRFDEIRPDARVFIFTLALTFITGLIFGLAPAFNAARTDLNETLKEGGRAGADGVVLRGAGGLVFGLVVVVGGLMRMSPCCPLATAHADSNSSAPQINRVMSRIDIMNCRFFVKQAVLSRFVRG